MTTHCSAQKPVPTAGSSFCRVAAEVCQGGLEIKFVEAFGQVKMEQFLRLFYGDTLAICRSLSKPLITMVQGYTRERACTLAFSGDLIIASDDADFGYPAVPNLAGPPGMQVWFLQRLIGRMKASGLSIRASRSALSTLPAWVSLLKLCHPLPWKQRP